MVIRKVWLLKAPVSAQAGAVVQVPTQCWLSGISSLLISRGVMGVGKSYARRHIFANRKRNRSRRLVFRPKHKLNPVVLAGLDPRLSGSAGVPLQRHLSGVGENWCFGIEQSVERSAMHQIEADQAGEGRGACNGPL